MPEITLMIIALALSFLLDRFLKPYLLRKRLGVVGGGGYGWLRRGRSDPLVGG